MLKKALKPILFQSDISIGKWPHLDYTPKLSEDAGVKMDGMNTSFLMFTRNILNWTIESEQDKLTHFENFRSVVRDRFVKVSVNNSFKHNKKVFSPKLLLIKKF